QPSIDLDKAARLSFARVGQQVDYRITVRNTSSSDSPDLVNVNVSDSLLGPLVVDGVAQPGVTLTGDIGNDGRMDFGEVWTITTSRTVLETDPDPLINEATVHANPDGFLNDITDSDDASVNLFRPGINIDKTGPELSKIGDPVTYTVTVASV